MNTHDLAGHVCSPALRLDILGRVPFFAHLGPTDLEAINERFKERGFTPGETVFAAGDPVDSLFIVATGELKWQHHTPQGQNVLLDVLIPGEFFGDLPILGHEVQSETVTAHTACCVLSAGADDVRGILDRYPGVAVRVLEHVARRLREAHEQIRHLAASTAEGRLAAILVRLATKLRETPGADEAKVPLSQQDLAEMAGTTLETVNRTLRRFRDDGWVATGRGYVVVRDADALHAASERLADRRTSGRAPA